VAGGTVIVAGSGTRITCGGCRIAAVTVTRHYSYYNAACKEKCKKFVFHVFGF
jgi:hypothetical protein